ncbi:MAG: hypothetical protein B7Y53_03385 [Halothiobacillus sp. 28-55-5]|nr:MAG: hypothetical protein B7Y53_03385 [Halothiobacillus sp. 28-55-5]
MAQTKRTPVNRRRTNEPNAASKWIVLLLIVAVALLAYVASQLWKKDAALGGHSAQQDTRSVKKPEEKAPQKPDFEFYTLLPQQNSGPVIPTPAPPAPFIKPEPVEKPPASPGTVAPNALPDAAPKPSERNFWIQAGSFATPAEANRRKAEIALQGFVSDVRTATVNGKQYYRIQIGPIAESQLAGVRKRLVEARIDTLPPKTTP